MPTVALPRLSTSSVSHGGSASRQEKHFYGMPPFHRGYRSESLLIILGFANEAGALERPVNSIKIT